MKLHLHTTPAAVASGAVTTDLLLLADLVRHKVLRSNSEVWLSTESDHPVLWALDATSRCVFVHRSRTPGILRLTADRLRWSAEKGADPSIDISAFGLTGSRTARVQFVLMDSRGGESMKVYDGGPNALIKPDSSSGWWRHGRWTAIDTATSRAWDWSGKAPELAVHEAHTLGAGLLAAAVPATEAAAVAEHVAPVVLDIDAPTFDAISSVHTYAEQAAEYVRQTIMVNGKELAGVS